MEKRETKTHNHNNNKELVSAQNWVNNGLPGVSENPGCEIAHRMMDRQDYDERIGPLSGGNSRGALGAVGWAWQHAVPQPGKF